MLAPQSHKKRQRRRKKLDVFTAATAPTPAPPKPPQIVQAKARLKSIFVQEEREVNQSILAHCRKDEPSVAAAEQQKRDEDNAFFTACIAADLISNTTGDSPTMKPITPSISSPSGNKQQLASSYIQMIDDNDVVEQPVTIKWAKEKNLFDKLHPTIIDGYQQDSEASPEAAKSPRNVEDEGLFVWPKPASLSKRNEKLLLNRWADDSDWILHNRRDFSDSSILLKTMESPKQFNPVRYIGSATGAHQSADEDRLLSIQIDKIQFNAPNSSNAGEESLIAGQIEDLYHFYIERMNNVGSIQHLEHKLATIRHLIKDVRRNDDRMKWLQMLQDRREIRGRLYHELQTDRDVLKRLLELWKRLKDVRLKQGHNKTAVKMTIKAESTDKDVDRTNWDTTFAIELHECLEEAIAELDQNQNPNRIEDELYEIYGRSLRQPGEPKLFLELHKSSMDDSLKAAKYFVEIRINDQQAATAINNKPIFVGHNRIPLNATFSIKLPADERPNVQLLVHEINRLSHRNKIVDLYLPIPDAHESFLAATFEAISFTTSMRTGHISIKQGWSTTTTHCPCPAQKNSTNIDVSKRTTVQQWIDDELLDPMDPDAISLVQSVQQPTQLRPTHVDDADNGLFRFDEDRTAFCAAEVINQDKRLNRLIERSQENIKFKYVRFVPSTGREIEDEDEEDISGHFEAFEWMDPIDLQRHEGKKYLRHLYKQITNYCEILNKNSVSQQDLLIGDSVPTIR